MPGITEIPPGVLKTRHRLSSSQVNRLFGHNVIMDSYEEKAAMLRKVAEFLAVTDLLRESCINFIPLKGPVLSVRLHGDSTARYFSDLDIMVDPSSVSRAREIFLARGYNEYSRPLPTDQGRQHRLLRYAHHIIFINPMSQVAFELHWRLLSGHSLNFRNQERLVRDNLYKINFEGRPFSVLSPELELIYLIIHGGFHHWGILKWLVDIHDYIVSEKIDWTRFCELSDSLKANRLVALCNTLLHELFPGLKPLPCSGVANRYMVSYSKMKIEGEYYTGPGSIKTILQNLYFSMAAYPGLKYKLRLAGSTIGNSLFFGRISNLLD